MARNTGTISMKGYRIHLTEDGIADRPAARQVVETIDRGLWNTPHGVLRDDVQSLRLDLAQARSLNEDLQTRTLDVVDRFNALDVDTLNKSLLDNAKLPKGSEATSSKGESTSDDTDSTSTDEPAKRSEESEGTNGTDKTAKGSKSDKSPKDDERSSEESTSASGASVDQIRALLDERLTPVVEVLPKDDEGRLYPVAPLWRVQALENVFEFDDQGRIIRVRDEYVLARDHDNDNFNGRAAALAAAVIFVLTWIVVGAVSSSVTLGFFVALGLGAFVGILVALLTKRNHHDQDRNTAAGH